MIRPHSSVHRHLAQAPEIVPFWLSVSTQFRKSQKLHRFRFLFFLLSLHGIQLFFKEEFQLFERRSCSLQQFNSFSTFLREAQSLLLLTMCFSSTRLLQAGLLNVESTHFRIILRLGFQFQSFHQGLLRIQDHSSHLTGVRQPATDQKGCPFLLGMIAINKRLFRIHFRTLSQEPMPPK